MFSYLLHTLSILKSSFEPLCICSLQIKSLLNSQSSQHDASSVSFCSKNLLLLPGGTRGMSVALTSDCMLTGEMENVGRSGRHSAEDNWCCIVRRAFCAARLFGQQQHVTPEQKKVARTVMSQ